MGLVDMDVRLRRVRTIATRRGHRLSTRQARRAGRGGSGARLHAIDPAAWAALGDEEREERLGEYATAAFRVMVSNATLFLSLGLSESETARALGRTVPPSVAAALGVEAVRDRRSLMSVSMAVAGETDEAQALQMFASEEYPPSWAFGMPRRGRQQLEAALAVAEVVRLARDGRLDTLAELKRFRARA